MSAFVLDTNVLVVANNRKGEYDEMPDCIEACVECLNDAKAGLVLLDDLGLIWAEYEKHANYSGEPGLGDYFFRWLHERQGSINHLCKIAIRPHESLGFENFPADSDLSGFDEDDRKFVAVALAFEGDAVIYNAVDSDWWHYRESLEKYGLAIVFLCPDVANAWQL